MSFPAYPAYKDSGVEWLGQVPKHWHVKKLRRVARLNPSKSEIAHFDRETELSFLPMEAVGDDGSLALDRTRPIGDVETGYTFFRENDVSIAKITPCFENGKGAIMRGLTGGAGFGTTELIVVRPKDGEISSDYLHLLFTSSVFRQRGEASMYGAGGQKRVPDDFVRDFELPLPPISEQKALVDFLAAEIGKIDALIRDQGRLIGLLKEKRQSSIAHAVSRGFDPSAPLVDSGVEWIGKIPKDWTVRTIRSVARLESGHTPSRSRPEWWTDCKTPWFTLGDVWQIREANRDYVEETAECVSQLGLENSSARLLPANTVMLSRTASVGFSAIMKVPMATSQDFANWVCGDRLLPEYLLLALRSMKPEFDRLMMGSTHNTIYMPDIRSLRIPLPTVDEQKEIVDHVKATTAKIDKLVAEATRSIELMKERRVALVSAAVMGKIDVRGLA